METMWTPDEMEKRIARFSQLKARPMTFLDAALPEFERDIFNIIGPGVSEEPEASAAITEASHFNIQMARVPPGHGAGLHAHQTVEVFFFMEGRWEVKWGEKGENSVALDRFDFISIPAGVMRGFKNISGETAHMFAVLGGDDPGHLTWSSDLVREAQKRL